MEKKLYKSSTNKVFGGVCGGIAEYFVVDAVIVRLLWVVFTLMGGAGLIAYIIAAIIIPYRDNGYQEHDSYVRSEDSGSEENHNSHNSALVFGIILVLLGAYVFFKDFLPWIPRDFFLAAMLIGLGIFFIIKRSK